MFPAANSLFGCVDDGVAVGGGGTRQQQQTAAVTANSSLFPYEIKSTCSSGGARLNSVSCPSNPDLVAYCCSGDVWVTNVVTGQEERLTFSSRCNPHAMADGGGVEVPPPSEDPLSAGLPSYVMQGSVQQSRLNSQLEFQCGNLQLLMNSQKNVPLHLNLHFNLQF